MTKLSMTPAVVRYFNACQTNNVQGVRAYLTTIHCVPHWAYQGLQNCETGLVVSEGAVRLICDYKKKAPSAHDDEWVYVSTNYIRRLLDRNQNTKDTIHKTLSVIMEANPKPNFDALIPSIGRNANVSVLEICLPYLSQKQKQGVFEYACKTKNNRECVERMLLEINIESCWTDIKNGLDNPYPENAEVVENFLFKKTLLNEVLNEVKDAQEIFPARKKM